MDKNLFPQAPGPHRAAMTAKCVEGTVFSVATWEIQHTETWPDFPEVCAELRDVVAAEFPHENILVVYVCGTDHARHCGGLLRQKNTGVCVVRRDGGSEGERGLTSQQPWNLFRATHATSDTSTVASYSSTHVSSTKSALSYYLPGITERLPVYFRHAS